MIIWLIEFPDGAVELSPSGTGNPPDRQEGQPTSVSTLWVRLAPGGEWRRVADGWGWCVTAARQRVAGCGSAEEAVRRLTEG